MEPKYKIPLSLRGSLQPEATLYVEPEDFNAALIAKVESLEKRVAKLEGEEIDSIETVSVVEEENKRTTQNVIPMQLPLMNRPVSPILSSRELTSYWDVTADTIKRMADRGDFKRVGRGQYDRKSVEKLLGGPIVQLVRTGDAAKHYGVSTRRAVQLGDRGRLKAIDFGLRERSNYRFDLSHEWSE